MKWGEIEKSINQNQVRKLGEMKLKEKERKIHNMSKMRSGQILEDEIVGMGSEIPREETQNKYGDAARAIEIEN